ITSATDAVRYGAAEYLIKPIGSAQLESSLRKAIDMARFDKAKRQVMQLVHVDRPEAGDRAGLEVTLDRALESLWLAYQPIMDAQTRTIAGYEALLRSAEPALPHPGAVLDAAERLGRLADVGRAVRSVAPQPMHDAPNPALLFVNLHASDLNDETLG